MMKSRSPLIFGFSSSNECSCCKAEIYHILLNIEPCFSSSIIEMKSIKTGSCRSKKSYKEISHLNEKEISPSLHKNLILDFSNPSNCSSQSITVISPAHILTLKYRNMNEFWLSEVVDTYLVYVHSWSGIKGYYLSRICSFSIYFSTSQKSSSERGIIAQMRIGTQEIIPINKWVVGQAVSFSRIFLTVCVTYQLNCAKDLLFGFLFLFSFYKTKYSSSVPNLRG